MVSITLVVGCVSEIHPTSVQPVPFCRDILFLILTNLMILAATTVGAISVSACCVLLAGLKYGHCGLSFCSNEVLLVSHLSVNGRFDDFDSLPSTGDEFV